MVSAPQYDWAWLLEQFARFGDRIKNSDDSKNNSRVVIAAILIVGIQILIKGLAMLE